MRLIPQSSAISLIVTLSKGFSNKRCFKDSSRAFFVVCDIICLFPIQCSTPLVHICFLYLFIYRFFYNNMLFMPVYLPLLRHLYCHAYTV